MSNATGTTNFMVPVAIGIGSNLGNSVGHVQKAVNVLQSYLHDVKVSPLFETSPMYVTDQPGFINAVLVGRSGQPPRALLRVLKTLEAEMGREESERFGPRVIDLDLLAFGALRYRFEYPGGKLLELPHPRIAERRFVVEPWAAIAPDWSLPGLPTPEEMLRQTFAGQEVRRIANEDLSAGVQ